MEPTVKNYLNLGGGPVFAADAPFTDALIPVADAMSAVILVEGDILCGLQLTIGPTGFMKRKL